MADEEATAVNQEVEQQDDTATESAPEENNSSEVVESKESEGAKDSGEYSQEDTEGEPENEETAEVTEQEEQPRGKAEERKQQLNTEIRDLVAQRNTLKEQVTRLNAQVYRPVTEQELLEQINPDTGQYYTAAEAKVDAFLHNQQLSEYNNQVAETQLVLDHEANRVMQDFPMFNPNSQEFDPQAAHQVATLMAKNLVVDQNTGQIIGSHIRPYELYQTVAMSARAREAAGQIKGQRATERMLASADNPSSAQQGEKPFNKMSLSEQTEYLRRKGHDI